MPGERPGVVKLLRWAGSMGRSLPIQVLFDGVTEGAVAPRTAGASFLIPPGKSYAISVEMDGYYSAPVRVFARSLHLIELNICPPTSAMGRMVSERESYFSLELAGENGISIVDMIALLRHTSSYNGQVTEISKHFVD